MPKTHLQEEGSSDLVPEALQAFCTQYIGLGGGAEGGVAVSRKAP